MQKFDHDEVRTVVEAPPEAVWEVIADITRMPQLSPEVVESRWVDGATEATVGARFVAKSKFSRGPAIGNKPVITAVDATRRISWSRTEPFGGTVEWTYELTPHADGTEVIESYRAIEPVSRLGWVLIGFFSTKDRAAVQRAGMEETLRRLKEVVESPARAS